MATRTSSWKGSGKSGGRLWSSCSSSTSRILLWNLASPFNILQPSNPDCLMSMLRSLFPAYIYCLLSYRQVWTWSLHTPRVAIIPSQQNMVWKSASETKRWLMSSSHGSATWLSPRTWLHASERVDQGHGACIMERASLGFAKYRPCSSPAKHELTRPFHVQKPTN